MDGLELRQTMMQSLVRGLQDLTSERAETQSSYRYAELTGRIETMRTLLDFLANADIGPCANCPKDIEQKEGDGSEETKEAE